MWPFKRKRKTYITTVDGTIGFFKEDYVRHHVSNFLSFYYIEIELKDPEWGYSFTKTMKSEYKTKEERDVALKSLNELLTQQYER